MLAHFHRIDVPFDRNGQVGEYACAESATYEKEAVECITHADATEPK